MAHFNVKTKNNLHIRQKPRVFFTCHPEDFDLYFQNICDDLFAHHDCAVYYTEDLTAALTDTEKNVDLENINLVVVPVTFKLLTRPNRAMDEDIPFFLSHHIPVLPIMMEMNIDHLYSAPNKFGELQYLSACSHDDSAISYINKLSKRLDETLLDNQIIQRIRDAFDAYTFLSYRKKDRAYANTLLHLIHSIPECQSVAIWFDEFLTPGENFRDSIRTAIESCQLFTLLVTPNVLEETDGHPNFIMGQEYPIAQQLGIPTLPVEMCATDHTALAKKFADLPDCIRVDADDFRAHILNTFGRLSNPTRRTSEQNYLLGLAYLYGVDVELNRQLGLQLLTDAAQAGHLAALRRLYQLYLYSQGVPLDYPKAVFWAERSVQQTETQYGAASHEAAVAWQNLSVVYNHAGQYDKELTAAQKAYTLYCTLLGEEHPETLNALSCYITAQYNGGDSYRQAKEILESRKKLFLAQYKVQGKTHPDTLWALYHLAIAYGKRGENFRPDHRKRLLLCQEVYDLAVEVFGAQHPTTLIMLEELAMAHSDTDNHDQALSILEQVYATQCNQVGETHRNATHTLLSIIFVCQQKKDYRKSAELGEKLYAQYCAVLGEDHPRTEVVRDTLAVSVDNLQDFDRLVELHQHRYDLQRQELGADHPDLIDALKSLEYAYDKAQNPLKVAQTKEEIHRLRAIKDGENHFHVLRALLDVAKAYRLAKAYPDAVRLYLRAQQLYQKENDDRGVLYAISGLALTYSSMDRHGDARPLYERIYAWKCTQQYGTDDMKIDDFMYIATDLFRLAECCYWQGDEAAALPLYQQFLSTYQQVFETAEDHHKDITFPTDAERLKRDPYDYTMPDMLKLSSIRAAQLKFTV